MSLSQLEMTIDPQRKVLALYFVPLRLLLIQTCSSVTFPISALAAIRCLVCSNLYFGHTAFWVAALCWSRLIAAIVLFRLRVTAAYSNQNTNPLLLAVVQINDKRAREVFGTWKGNFRRRYGIWKRCCRCQKGIMNTTSRCQHLHLRSRRLNKGASAPRPSAKQPSLSMTRKTLTEVSWCCMRMSGHLDLG